VVRIWDCALCAIRSVGLYAHSVAHLLQPRTKRAIYWVRVFSGLEEVRVKGSVDEETRERLRALRWRRDGRGVRIVFEE
jgi:hypothetical protein